QVCHTGLVGPPWNGNNRNFATIFVITGLSGVSGFAVATTSQCQCCGSQYCAQVKSFLYTLRFHISSKGLRCETPVCNEQPPHSNEPNNIIGGVTVSFCGAQRVAWRRPSLWIC